MTDDYLSLTVTRKYKNMYTRKIRTRTTNNTSGKIKDIYAKEAKKKK